MLILYTLVGLIIYIGIVIMIGKINFDDDIKKYLFLILSGTYNCFIGYIDTYVLLLLYGYFANMPKGSGYEVPESETEFNAMLGIITIGIYIMLLIPINIYMKRKGKVVKVQYENSNVTMDELKLKSIEVIED